MLFIWAMVILAGVIMMVLGPVLLVTKSMVLIGIVLVVLGALVLFRGLLGASASTESKVQGTK
jgi:hypothetical protein